MYIVKQSGLDGLIVKLSIQSNARRFISKTESSLFPLGL